MKIFRLMGLLFMVSSLSSCAIFSPSKIYFEPPVPIKVFADGIRKVDGLAFSPDGVLYATGETLLGGVVRIENNGEVSRVESFISRADGIAFDPQGNILVSSESPHGKVYRLTSAGKEVVLSGIRSPEGMAFGRSGRLYVAEDRPDGSIIRLTDGQAFKWVFGLKRPENLAFDPDGNLYVTETATGKVLRLNPLGHQSVQVESGIIREPDGIAYCEAYDGFFVSEDKRDGRVFYVPQRGDIKPVARDLKKPQGLVCDTDGNLYISEQGRNRILRIDYDDLATFLLP